jgi:hypothetical protein
MSDLVKRLLDIAGDTNEENETIHETADYIEKLEAALREIAYGPRDADKSYVSLFYEIQSEARKALDAK